MNAYIWQEFEGDRGANNIASCLLLDLKRRGWLNGPNYSELTYIADNCGGQNKNKVVVRFLMRLVENRIFPKVTLFFLVKGHTKNAADRMFNLLKLSYHCCDIFTYDQLHSKLNQNEYVNVFQTQPKHFHDHLEWQDKHYRTPTEGEFKQTHVFTICSAAYGQQPHLLLKKDDCDAPIRIDNLKPNSRSKKAKRISKEERIESIGNMERDLKLLTPTPLKPIKQVELWKKWGPLLPEEARVITCPKPSDEVIESIKERTRAKGKERVAEKKKRQLEKEKGDGTANDKMIVTLDGEQHRSTHTKVATAIDTPTTEDADENQITTNNSNLTMM